MALRCLAIGILMNEFAKTNFLVNVLSKPLQHIIFVVLRSCCVKFTRFHRQMLLLADIKLQKPFSFRSLPARFTSMVVRRGCRRRSLNPVVVWSFSCRWGIGSCGNAESQKFILFNCDITGDRRASSNRRKAFAYKRI